MALVAWHRAQGDRDRTTRYLDEARILLDKLAKGLTFVSDELNGVTKDNGGNIRPLRPRTFTTFSQAEEENGQSRIYLGIHWSFDKTGGISQGRKVAEYVFKRAFKRLP